MQSVHDITACTACTIILYIHMYTTIIISVFVRTHMYFVYKHQQ